MSLRILLHLSYSIFCTQLFPRHLSLGRSASNAPLCYLNQYIIHFECRRAAFALNKHCACSRSRKARINAKGTHIWRPVWRPRLMTWTGTSRAERRSAGCDRGGDAPLTGRAPNWLTTSSACPARGWQSGCRCRAQAHHLEKHFQ